MNGSRKLKKTGRRSSGNMKKYESDCLEQMRQRRRKVQVLQRLPSNVQMEILDAKVGAVVVEKVDHHLQQAASLDSFLIPCIPLKQTPRIFRNETVRPNLEDLHQASNFLSGFQKALMAVVAEVLDSLLEGVGLPELEIPKTLYYMTRA